MHRLVRNLSPGQDRRPPQDFRPKGLASCLEATITAEITLEPFRCQMRHFLQGTRFLKQMGRSRHDSQVFFRVKLGISLPIEI